VRGDAYISSSGYKRKARKRRSEQETGYLRFPVFGAKKEIVAGDDSR